jgi:electron transport complex protein RnfE
MGKMSILTNGIIKENPVLVLVLGTCPALAVSTGVINAVGMGIAATFVLIGSNLVISLLKSLIPDKVRIPCYIVVIAGFVTIAELLLHAYVPDLYSALGIFLPLIVVNCIILGRAEMFASKHSVFDSILDGIGMGIGFTLALFLIAVVREVVGAGTFMKTRCPFRFSAWRRADFSSTRSSSPCSTGSQTAGPSSARALTAKPVRLMRRVPGRESASDEGNDDYPVLHDFGPKRGADKVPGNLLVSGGLQGAQGRDGYEFCGYLRHGDGNGRDLADLYVPALAQRD